MNIKNNLFFVETGRENFFVSKTDALAAIYKKLDRDICRACPYRVFLECENDTALPVIKRPGAPTSTIV